MNVVRDKTDHSSTLVGWREWVALPSAGVEWVKAKVDTGARSSSIHAYDIREVDVDGVAHVRFLVRPWQRSTDDVVELELPVHDQRDVRSSSGHTEQRYVVLLSISLCGREVTAEFTLTNRDAMGFRMLIGREALRQGFVVDPSRSFLGGRAPKHVRRANRGAQ